MANTQNTIDISVIIPVYNTENYLRKCIDSVIKQQIVSKEIILVDDGSTDSSGRICDEYSRKYPFIYTTHIKNSGPATAKNVGLEQANGDYISFTDSDDELEPTMFFEMINAGRNFDAEIICCNLKDVDIHGYVSNTKCSGETLVLDKEEAIRRLLSKDLIYTAPVTKIFRRDLLLLNNLNHDDGLKTDEDFIMNIKAFAKCTCCVIVDKCFYRINYRDDSLSHGYFKHNISKYISNRFYRAQLIEKTLSEECPELIEWAYLQNIMYFNELIGRITTFPSLFLDKRTREIISYIRKHWNVLTKYHWKCGFSKLGCYLLKYMPIYLYMYYRRMKIQK